MTRITKIATLTLIVGANTLFASSNDYALTNNYKLLNDMKLAQKQQEIIINMSNQLNKDIIDSNSLKNAENRFSKILIGLSNGDISLNLKGTNIPQIKEKLSEVQKLWQKEKTMLNGEIKDSDKKEKAIANLNNIMLKMSEAIALYNKSYERFKQKSKLSSLVNHHMNSRKNQTFAFNTVQ